MRVNSECAKAREPSLWRIAEGAMISLFFKKMRTRSGSATKVSLFGNVLFEFAIGSSWGELKLLGEEVERALQANDESSIRDSRGGKRVEADLGPFHLKSSGDRNQMSRLRMPY